MSCNVTEYITCNDGTLNNDDPDRILTEAQYNTLLWTAALGALLCELPTEQKIRLLGNKLLTQGVNVDHVFLPTGLQPFDTAFETAMEVDVSFVQS